IYPWELLPWNMPPDYDTSPATFKRYAELGLEGLILVDELALRETTLREEGESLALGALLRRLDSEFRVRLLITQPISVEMINAARKRLPNVRIQVAPHAVFMSREMAVERIGRAAFHSPPFRPAAEVEAMRRHVEAGDVDILCSHHVPHRIGDKFATDALP